jgi:hypothetical protein
MSLHAAMCLALTHCGLVVHAALIRQPLLSHVLEHIQRLATIAALACASNVKAAAAAATYTSGSSITVAAHLMSARATG